MFVLCVLYSLIHVILCNNIVNIKFTTLTLYLQFAGAKVYDAIVDMQGMTVTVIDNDEESQQSAGFSEQEEDMADYYNQPETLLEDPVPAQPAQSSSTASMQSTGLESQPKEAMPSHPAESSSAVSTMSAMATATANLLSAMESSMASLQQATESSTADDDTENSNGSESNSSWGWTLYVWNKWQQ